jgi:hypothetical protein
VRRGGGGRPVTKEQEAELHRKLREVNKRSENGSGK